MQGLFFVGTDTGVGKTHVTATVARLLCRRGCAVRVCKPVATGAERHGDVLVSEDTRLLLNAVELEETPENFRRVTPFVFAAPAAPPVAARVEGRSLRLDEIVEAVRRPWSADEVVLVEGVGGLLCPLTETETIADLAAVLQLPLIVVARRSLGTLNHTLLTVEVARARGLIVAGVVISETQPPRGVADETNVEELRRRLPVLLPAVLPYQPLFASDALAEVPWESLARKNVEKVDARSG
jgi:dethiobiotin synthetase